ncbi:signal transduction histidine kinase [Kibdelosporangium banguiense]|uniref:histidine kinase n=1 Tax=Kibdelosporangium banguiense TaxID=1365924 RepID=A0ABS4T6D5_9PSEU|nr:sensor histidine kinase [Kibdelosporangium banguiense]MBP2319980.1 signal transduction histidine kinase [Kibdelosporangium banguiense]
MTTGDSRVWVADLLLAGAVAVISVGFALTDWVASLLALALSASLAFRRTYPVVALVWATTAAVAHALLLTNLTLSVVVVPMLVHGLARWSGRGLALTALGIGLAGAVAGPLWSLSWRAEAKLSDMLVPVAACAGVVIAAHVFGQRERERADTLLVRRRLERIEHDRAVQEAAAEERTQIAREVHDIVAHSLSMIAVQAEGGRALVTRDPSRAPEVLTVIAEESRTALNEIRDMVSLLRGDAAYRPAPGLMDIKDLVDRLGDRAHLDIAGRPPVIGPVLTLTIYRVIQESLTNFLRHAGPKAKAAITITTAETSTSVTIRDNGRGSTAPTDGKGHGLRTMHERVTASGGTMSAGAVPDGGFEVHAVFPLERVS